MNIISHKENDLESKKFESDCKNVTLIDQCQSTSMLNGRKIKHLVMILKND